MKLKTYAIESGNKSGKKYVLIKELWNGDKLLQFDYRHSDILSEGYELKEEHETIPESDSANSDNRL